MPVYKIVLIGDGGVGKTAIRERYLGKEFNSQYLLTIGADFSIRDDTIQGSPVRYQIWDLAGQQRFEAVRTLYYKACVSALLVYDVTRPDSFFNTPQWLNELWTNNGRGRVPVIVVANKIDLREETDVSVSTEQGKVFTERLNKITAPTGFGCYYVETSAKTGENIDLAFSKLGDNIVKFLESTENVPQQKT